MKRKLSEMEATPEEHGRQVKVDKAIHNSGGSSVEAACSSQSKFRPSDEVPVEGGAFCMTHSSSGRSLQIENFDNLHHFNACKGKLENLAKAVEDIFTDEDASQVMDLVGGETFQHLVALRHGPWVHNTRDLNAKLSLDRRYRALSSENTLPRVVSEAAITPWAVAELCSTLPPLPNILDPVLRDGAFTHAGVGAGRITDLNYERLEWVGDAYIELISTLLISKTFPHLLPGKSSQLREKLVKNLTLSQFAIQYDFKKRAIIPKGSTTGPNPIKDAEWVKIFGDMFEAYVAAVIISDPVQGISRAVTWLKQLWSTTIEKEIRQNERKPMSGHAMHNPLWNRRQHCGTAERKVDCLPPEEIRNPKERLTRMIGVKGITIAYKDAGPEKKDKETKQPIFTVGCYLDGWGEKNKQLGFGSAQSKKEAGWKAAEMAMANKKLMKPYVEKKKVYDQQMEAETAALEKQNALAKQDQVNT